MSIAETAGKIKRWSEGETGRNVYMIAVVVLVGFGAFGLGRLSVKENQRREVVISSDIIKSTASAGANMPLSPLLGSASSLKVGETAGASTDGPIMASSRGSKYYPAGCAGAKTLSSANKIYFQTEEEATAAGYTKSSSCK